MKAASLAEIKRELKTLDQEGVSQLCLRLGRFKKENKELLTYLLFEMKDEQAFISSVKEDISDGINEINISTLHFAKKGIRKVLRNASKMIRYSGNKQTEVEVLIHFCQTLKSSKIDIQKSVVVSNLFDRQVVKIRKALVGLHEDLQADYLFELDQIWTEGGS